MRYLLTPSYWLTTAMMGFVIFKEPHSLGVSNLIVAVLAGSFMIKNGLKQMHSGAALAEWKSPELQFLMATIIYCALSIGKSGEILLSVASMVAAVVIYNLSRGIGEHYKPQNPMIFR